MIQDAGGAPLANGGGRIRTGRVFRIAGNLGSDAELGELDATGMRTVIDLRHEDEDRSGVIGWAERRRAGYLNFPIAAGGYQAGKYEAILAAIHDGTYKEYTQRMYGELAVAFGDEFARSFTALAEQDHPAGFGCAAGKDRTGVMNAYLEVLLGASEETAIATYLAKAPTEAQMRAQLERLYGFDPDDEIPPGFQYCITVHPESMEHVFKLVNERGGVAQYLTDHGLTAEAIARLREKLVEPA